MLYIMYKIQMYAKNQSTITLVYNRKYWDTLYIIYEYISLKQLIHSLYYQKKNWKKTEKQS